MCYHWTSIELYSAENILSKFNYDLIFYRTSSDDLGTGMKDTADSQSNSHVRGCPRNCV